jgi:flagellar biosynthesis GTPase FlhF
MGNEASQPTNYNNDILNKINNLLNTNTEIDQPNQYGSSTWSVGSRFTSKSQKGVSGTLREKVTNAGGINQDLWNVVLDSGKQTPWAVSDMIDPADEEKRKQAAEKARESERLRREESERRKRETEEKARESERLRKEESERRKRETEEKARESERQRKEAAEEKERQRKEAAEKEAIKRREEAEKARVAALEKEKQRVELQKTQIRDEIKKNELLIENFETQIETTSKTLTSRPDSERKGLINKLGEYETQKMKHVEIVKTLNQKLASMK